MSELAVKQAATVIDKYAGARLRMRRMELGLSQSEVADALGLTFQQVQKYEKGSNRMSTGRLHQLAEMLKVPPSFFFDGADAHAAPGGQLEGEDLQTGFLTTRYGVRLAAAFVKISDTRLQERVVSLVEQLVARSDPGRVK
jgi:transcriptional regulator with XRE-family HTH domain